MRLMSSPTLELVGIKKSFGETEDFEVLREITLSANKGEFVCILGPSGAGKTILLYLAAGFLKPSEGQVLIDGQPAGDPGSNRMMIFQNYVLFPWKSVYQNILFALDQSPLSSEEKDVLVMKYLNLMNLEAFKDWYPYKLSGGMQQRVALARALVTNPKILLMDEPFAALDSQYRKFLRQNLETIWTETGKTVIFVTHSINEALSLADKIYLLSARPAVVQKVYEVKLPRPRNPLDPEYIKLRQEIDAVLSEEFEKIIKNPSMEESLTHILKLTGKKRGVL